jgi:ketosteroid isomerase-like protein
MKTTTNTVGKLVLFSFLGGCAVHAHVDVGAGDDDREAIEKVRFELQDAMREGSPEGAVAVFADDVVVMSPNRPAYEGIDAARRWATLDLTQTHPTMSFEIDELELAGDWAIERGTYWQGAGKRVWVYQRQDDDSWKIKYIMWSSNSK